MPAPKAVFFFVPTRPRSIVSRVRHAWPQFTDPRAHRAVVDLAHLEQTAFVRRPAEGWEALKKRDRNLRQVYTADGRRLMLR